MSGINETLLRLANMQLAGNTKYAFAPMPGGMPPMDPAAAGGMPPMDPAAMGGMPPPPMDPSMMPAAMGMDPAAAMAGAGMPMDPAMAMAGGAPMTPDGAAVQGAAPAPTSEQPSIDPALQAAIDDAVAKATGGAGGQGGGEKPKSSGGKVSPESFMALQSDVAEMKGMLQKAIGYLMGAGKLEPNDADGASLGAADGAAPAAELAPQKVAFVRSRSDGMLSALVDLLGK